MTEIIRQPNKVTNAKYAFTSIQKNIIYKIIEKLQKDMKRLEDARKSGSPSVFSELQKNLFNETEFTFKIKSIDKNNNYTRLVKEARRMCQMPVEYTIDRENGTYDVFTGLVSTVEHLHGSEFISFVVPSRAIPFLCYIENGFTAYQQTIAISLKSKYSKRMYEMCSRWKDKGGFTISVEEFRETLMLEGKFKQITEVKNRVLEIAMKELEKSADVWFSYKLRKQSSRSFNWIDFKVFSSAKSPKKNNETEYSIFIYNFLTLTFPAMFNSHARDITAFLQTSTHFSDAYHRFFKLHEEYQETKDIVKLKKMTRTILREDFLVKHYKKLTGQE